MDLTCAGNLTIAGGTTANQAKIAFSNNLLLITGQGSFGANTGSVVIAGGSSEYNAGAKVSVLGNETGGHLYLQPGNGASSNLYIDTTASSSGRIYIQNAASGYVDLTTDTLIYNSPPSGGANLFSIYAGTANGADNNAITISGGGFTSYDRGAYLILGGSENSSYAGSVVLCSGQVGGGSPASMEFRIGANEAMRIDGSTRSLLINTTSTVSGYEVVVNGDIQATTFNATSSRALKKDIVPFLQSALDVITQTEIVSYRYKTDDDTKSSRVGIIADDSDEILAGRDHNSFMYGNAIALSLKAIQELSDKIKKLESDSLIKKLWAKLKGWFTHAR
jgi:hypothetical protein